MDDMYKINNFNRSKRTIGKTEQIKNTNSKTTHIKNNNKCKYRRTNLEQRDGTSKKPEVMSGATEGSHLQSH